MPTQYYVRYRCGYGGRNTALIVEDDQQNAYLFSDGSLQSKMQGKGAAVRLARLMRRRGHWRSLPPVSPYTIDGLCRLIGAAPGPSVKNVELPVRVEAEAAL